ncbi:MAG: SDR family oxidoreductase [Fimbriimonas ginsengisoli]|uniref:SDR family oxidoreductase n=1 Tax=Fimbriimonas ginsengisoli TaxID=1005039 RepID=A0A931LW16_FIMGI|nr:SDR family oxidoreductase [Fimbriimonas ginsengisoli]
MDFGLEGRVAMVAAASKGIGLACAKALVDEGCSVSICARGEEGLEAASIELGEASRTYCVDVADAADLSWWVDETRKDLGPPNILVTNTGGPPAGPLADMTDEQWQAGFDGTLMNVIRLVRLVAPDMEAKGWGRIVHLSSLAAKEPGVLLPISSTLRTGLNALTRLQATQYAPKGITVNAVLPGHTLTDRQLHLAEVRAQQQGLTPEEALAKQAAEVPVGRFARPEEIGAVVAFICSNQAAFLTGAALLVDGGQTKGPG